MCLWLFSLPYELYITLLLTNLVTLRCYLYASDSHAIIFLGQVEKYIIPILYEVLTFIDLMFL